MNKVNLLLDGFEFLTLLLLRMDLAFMICVPNYATYPLDIFA